MGEYHCFYVHMNIYVCQKNWEKAASEKKYGIIGLRLKGSESASWWMGCFNEWDVMKGRHAFKDINILIGLFWRGFHLLPRCFPLLSLGWHKHYQGALTAAPPHRCGGLWKPWQKSPLFPLLLFLVSSSLSSQQEFTFWSDSLTLVFISTDCIQLLKVHSGTAVMTENDTFCQHQRMLFWKRAEGKTFGSCNVTVRSGWNWSC